VARAPRNSLVRQSPRHVLPRTFEPQLPTLVKSAPTGSQWVHEVKYDGYRIGARIDRGNINLFTRNGNDWTATFPGIAAAVRELPLETALLDGEAAVLLAGGITSFQALQGTLKQQRRGQLVYFVFDLLHLDGCDLTGLPLEERKALLEQIADEAGAPAAVIRYSHHLEGDGAEVLRRACRTGFEGIVSKRRDRPYEIGRSRDWLKTKCVKRQEFVIGGFTDPEGSRVGMGALLIGFYDGRDLRFAGKVGTGFTADVLMELRRRLNRLEHKDCPFSPGPGGRLGRSAHWVKPELVAEIAFTEWTEDGKIRHPLFQGLRNDKPAPQVVREQPLQLPGPQADRTKNVDRDRKHR
jgi:bifunctional non-homologous end joining protein LigD